MNHWTGDNDRLIEIKTHLHTYSTLLENPMKLKQTSPFLDMQHLSLALKLENHSKT